MKATITKVKKVNSNYGGICYLITMKGEDGKSYKTWIFEKHGNFYRWQGVIKSGVGTAVDGLVKAGKDLIDGDSFPRILNLTKQNNILK